MKGDYTVAKRIARNIRKSRQKANLTQEKLAELSGLSVNYIYRLERQEPTMNISAQNLISISNGLHVDITELVYGKETKNSSHKRITSTDKLIDKLSSLSDEEEDEFSKLFLEILSKLNK